MLIKLAIASIDITLAQILGVDCHPIILSNPKIFTPINQSVDNQPGLPNGDNSL